MSYRSKMTRRNDSLPLTRSRQEKQTDIPKVVASANHSTELREHDWMMVQIKKIISYDKSKSSWAVIFKGNKVIQVVSGNTILQVFRCENWEKQVTERGGVENALTFQIESGRETEHHCIRLEFPCTVAGKIPLSMNCPDCREQMVALTVFVCCKDVVVDDGIDPHMPSIDTDKYIRTTYNGSDPHMPSLDTDKYVSTARNGELVESFDEYDE